MIFFLTSQSLWLSASVVVGLGTLVSMLEILRAQVVMTALLAMLIFSELLIIIAIDRPFSAAVKVEPKPLPRCLPTSRTGPAAAPGGSRRSRNSGWRGGGP